MPEAVSMKVCNSQTLRDAAFSYNAMGYKILKLKPRTKEAFSPGWSKPDYSDSPNEWNMHKDNNIGMPLGRNGFFVIDIDNKADYVKSMKAIEDKLVGVSGVDTMFWESETIGINSGKPGSEKYMFRIPAGYENSMKCKKINWVNKELKYHSVVEFRCGDGFQDVMPPSIHPSGTTYQFVNGDYALDMPQDLLWLVCNMKLFIEDMLSANPDYVKPVRVKDNVTGRPYDGDDYAQMWCDKEFLPSWLSKYGYKSVGNNRFLSPHSTSGSPGVVLFPDGKKFYSHGASDPFSDGCPHNAYDLLVHYEFNGSYKEAWKYILNDLGVNRVKNRSRTASWS